MKGEVKNYIIVWSLKLRLSGYALSRLISTILCIEVVTLCDVFFCPNKLKSRIIWSKIFTLIWLQILVIIEVFSLE